MNVNVVLFDLDGTLINTIPAIAGSFNYVLEKLGYNTYPVEKFKEFVGGGFFVVYDRINSLQEIKEDRQYFIDLVREHYHEHCLEEAKIYDGIPELLDSLVANGIDICIVTNKDNDLAVKHAETMLKKWHFKYVYGASVTKEYPTKPDPYLVNLIAKDYKKENMLFVGDMKVDVDIAYNAGIDMVYCTWGYGKDSKVEAKNIVNTPKHVWEYING